MKPHIAIVNSSSFGKVIPEHLAQLQEIGEVERIAVPNNVPLGEFAERLRGVKAVVASVTPYYPDELLRQLPGLLLIARHGIGCDNVNLAAADECGIIVTRVAGIVERAAVAEHALALMLSASRCIPEADAAVRRGEWSRRAEWIGVELSGKTIGLIGLGNIGSGLARILRHGFGAKVLAFDPGLSAEEIERRDAVQCTLEELLENSDFISLHLALTPKSARILGQKQFSLMRRGVILVNTARGELIDEDALIDALRSGIVRSYATDVVTGEPITGEHRLLRQPGVTVVPHLGGYTYESLRGMGETMVRNVREVLLEGKVPENIVNAVKRVRL